MRQKFIQNLVQEKNKALAVAFNSTFSYIGDILSIKNCDSHSYVNSIYPTEIEIKEITDSETNVSYLDILLKKDANGKLTIKLYDKRDNFNFSNVNSPYLCSNISSSPAYGIYVS